MAVRALLKAATPTGSESTPEPTMDLTRFAVDAVRPALPSSSAAAAAATNVVARSIGRGVDSRESGCTCSAATPPRASTQTRLRMTDTDIRKISPAISRSEPGSCGGGKLTLPPANFWKSVPRAAHMVALDIKPSAGGLVTHERMTAYIASKGVNELYADSLEALLRAAARHGQS